LRGDVGERAVAAVEIQLTPAEHAGHEQVQEPVLVIVEDGRVPGPAAAAETGAVGNVGEGPVAIVAVENIEFLGSGHEGSEVGLALVGPCRGVEDVGGPMRRVGEKQIEIAVVVVIEKHRGLRVTDVAQPGFRRDVFEGAVARVAVQGVRPVLVEKVDVLVAIVVVIAHRQARAVIVQVDAEPLALFLRQVMHPKRDPGLPGALLKARSSTGSLCLVTRAPDDQDSDDRDHERPRRHRRCDRARHVWECIAGAVSAMPEEGEVVAVASPSKGHAAGFAKRHGIPHAYTDYRELLSDPQVEMISITAPNRVHAQITIDAARAGKHVVCEKPMCLTLEEADAMIDACRKAGVLLLYAEELFFAPKYVKAKQLADEGAFGRVHLVKQGEKH